MLGTSPIEVVMNAAEKCELFTYEPSTDVQLLVVLKDKREFVEAASSEEAAYERIYAKMLASVHGF